VPAPWIRPACGRTSRWTWARWLLRSSSCARRSVTADPTAGVDRRPNTPGPNAFAHCGARPTPVSLRAEGDLLELLLAQNARLLPSQFPVAEQGKVGNATDVEFRRKRGRTLRVDLEHERFAGKAFGRLGDGGSGHFAGTAPFRPEINQHGHSGLARYLVEQHVIDVNRGAHRRQWLFATAAAAGVGQVMCRDAILRAAMCAGPDHCECRR